MTTLMAFDTVFEQCSVAILQDGQVIYSDTMAGSRGQTEIILSMVDKAFMTTGLSLHRLDALAFNRGPGAFSGIRINTAVVQALAVAASLPCVGVSSLTALAYTAHLAHRFDENIRISAVMDARQNQVYLGQFIIQDNEPQPMIDSHNPYGNESLLDYQGEVIADIVVGDGVQLVASTAQRVSVQPTAVEIGKIGYDEFIKHGGVPAQNALPVYLRDNAWKTLAQQGKALVG